jgi:anti-sigma B factor antagonist
MNGDSYAVDWSVPASSNQSTCSSDATRREVARGASDNPLGMEANLVDMNGQTTVTVRGEVDIACAGALWETLQRGTVAGSTLVVDLSGTRFMDSSGLDVLLRTRRQLATIGSTLVLRSPHERVMKLLQISGLDGVFTIEVEPRPNDNGHEPSKRGRQEGQQLG